jgi:hypothetical protein
MARWNRMHYDYRGPEYDLRYGRYEGAFARRAALEAWEAERPHGPRSAPPPRWAGRAGPGRTRQWLRDWWAEASPYDDEYLEQDWGYSRRWWPAALRRQHRYD